MKFKFTASNKTSILQLFFLSIASLLFSIVISFIFAICASIGVVLAWSFLPSAGFNVTPIGWSWSLVWFLWILGFVVRILLPVSTSNK